MDMLGDLAVRRERASEHEGDVVAAHDEARPVADAGLESGKGDRGEAPQRPEVVRRLLRVADPELDVVDALQRQEVLGLVVGVLVDVRAGLVGGPAADRVGHVAGLRAVTAATRTPDRAAARPRDGDPALGRDGLATHATPVVRDWAHGWIRSSTPRRRRRAP